MRAEKSDGRFRVKAIAGTRVVLLAINPETPPPADFRGFAIRRSAAGGSSEFLTGIKFFDGTVPHWTKGQVFSSNEQPIQTLFWSDYAASPGVQYQFTVIPKLGSPGHLRDGQPIAIAVKTEAEDDGRHGVWFNRGVVASHKFSVDFQNAPLTRAMADNVKGGTLLDKEAAWLSRGLAEACLAYIGGAKKGDGLRVCAYEFTWNPILAALKDALDRGVDVRIIYHAVPANQAAIDAAGLPAKKAGRQILFKRTRPPIPHNKFIVKIEGGKPTRVWTGSTNFTDTGFLGQTNVGHLVTDDTVARTYLDYWTGLSANPAAKAGLANSTALTPNPPNVLARNSITPFYSPRVADNMLDWYGQRIVDACALTLMTLPFNVAPPILQALTGATRSLRLTILENEPTKDVVSAEIKSKGRLVFSNGAILGKNFVHRASGGATVEPISQGHLDDWFIDEELARPVNQGHVFFVHSKILLIDPLSDDPLVCTGSANFSSNSLTSNDENMLLIRGDTRVADIYLTELDRVFRHFYDRDAINRIALHGGTPEGLHLDTTSNWLAANFKAGSYKHNRLTTFFPDGVSTCAWFSNAAHDADPFQGEARRAGAKRTARNAGARTGRSKRAPAGKRRRRG